MHVFNDLPDLTMEEARRCWLRPQQVLDVAKLDDRDPSIRKWFDNVVYRGGHLPSEPRTVGRVTTRSFSLVACVMLRAIHEETQRGYQAPQAEVVARAVADLLPEALAFPTLRSFCGAEYEGAPWRVLFVEASPGDGAVKTEVVGGTEFTVANIMARDWWACSSVFPHQTLLRCIETYAQLWGEQRDREANPRRRRADPPIRVSA